MEVCFGARRAVPAVKAERPLWVGLGTFAGTRSNEEIAPIRAIRPVGPGALLDPRRMGAAVV